MKDFSEPVVCPVCGPAADITIFWVRRDTTVPQLHNPKFLNHAEIQSEETFVGIVCQSCGTVWAEGCTENFKVRLAEESAACPQCDSPPAPIPYHAFLTCADLSEREEMELPDEREEFEEDLGLADLTPKQQDLVGRLIDRIFNCCRSTPCQACADRVTRIYELVERFAGLNQKGKS